jgi:hypothetical protein
MPVLLQYAYLCDAGDYVNDEWREESQGEPTHCRENSSHTLIGTSVRIVSRQDPNETHVVEENTPTGGNYCYDNIAFTAPANSVYTHSAPIDAQFNINVLSISFVTKGIHEGDTVYVLSGADTSVGPIAADITAGATQFTAASLASIPYIEKGYKIKVSDGVNTDDLGFVLGTNVQTGVVTCSVPTTHAFAAGANILITRVLLGRTAPMELGPAWIYNIGQDKIGASYLPAGTEIAIVYDNKSPTDAKRFVINFSYLY